MRLAVFSGQYFWLNNQTYSTDEAFVKFVTSFHRYFDEIIFCDAVIRDETSRPYRLDPATSRVCPLPYFSLYSSWKDMWAILPKVCHVVTRNIHDWDVVWLQAPHPISLILACICMKWRKPFFLFIRQNLRVYVGHRNSGIRRRLAIWVAALLEHLFGFLFRRTLTFAVGKDLFHIQKKRGKRVYPVEVSLVSEQDIVPVARNQIPENRGNVKLLYVGRLDPEKGLAYLIRALHLLLRDSDTKATLQLAGAGPEEPKLRLQVDRLGLSRNVTFLGYVDYGADLFDVYKNNDIFILPSLTEGCPQVLFEAMACGIPIVATKVGGVPYLINDEENGLLVDLQSSTQIVEAVLRLVNEPELGKRLVTKGLSTVRNHTIEVQTQRMMAYVGRLVSSPEFATTERYR